MASCSEMKKDQVYVCGECGLELQVVGECRDADKDAAECGCHDEDEKEPCELSCCGRELTLKQG
jgi:hypothetical protein